VTVSKIKHFSASFLCLLLWLFSYLFLFLTDLPVFLRICFDFHAFFYSKLYSQFAIIYLYFTFVSVSITLQHVGSREAGEMNMVFYMLTKLISN